MGLSLCIIKTAVAVYSDLRHALAFIFNPINKFILLLAHLSTRLFYHGKTLKLYIVNRVVLVSHVE
jgi:hypothetical protein